MAHPHEGAARKALAGAEERSSLFEAAVGTSIEQVCGAVDRALIALLEFDAAAAHLKEPAQSHYGRAVRIFGKALTDIMGALELVRRGYEAQALGIMRSAVESWATALLVIHDESVGRQFFEGRYSTNDSVHRVLKHKAIPLSPAMREGMRTTYKSLHVFAHPSAMGMVPMVGKKGLFLGGSFDAGKVGIYEQILAGCAQMAMNIETAVPKLPAPKAGATRS